MTYREEGFFAGFRFALEAFLEAGFAVSSSLSASSNLRGFRETGFSFGIPGLYMDHSNACKRVLERYKMHRAYLSVKGAVVLDTLCFSPGSTNDVGRTVD